MSDPWHCNVCGRVYPVASLSRDCEQRHEGSQQCDSSKPC